MAGELRVAMAKNKEYRVVPLTQRLRVLLEQMKEEATPRPSSPVFKGVEIKKGLAAALKRAGIEKHISQLNALIRARTKEISDFLARPDLRNALRNTLLSSG